MRIAGTRGFSYITIHLFRLSSAMGCLGIRSPYSLEIAKSLIRRFYPIPISYPTFDYSLTYSRPYKWGCFITVHYENEWG